MGNCGKVILHRGDDKCMTDVSPALKIIYSDHAFSGSIYSAYRIAGNIGGELYLADWRFPCHTANIKSANIAPTPGECVAIVP